MGNPKKIRKKYDRPKRPWDKTRIIEEKDLLAKYGLISKKELRIMEGVIAKKRETVKKLLTASQEVAEKGRHELVSSLNKIGLVSKDATFTDILGLTVQDVLERRLQTMVYRLGLANTVKQARQFITHGFIVINGRRITIPSYLVTVDEDKFIGYFGNEKPKVLEATMKKPELQKSAKTEAQDEKSNELVDDVLEEEETEVVEEESD
jgi:small subunit ribosomal protein S4